MVVLAGVTQPPWLHQFRLGWTQVHPNYWIYCRYWGWVNSFFFPSLTSRLPIKKIYSTAQAFQTPTTYLPIKNPKPRRHSRAKAMLQKMVLHKQCWSVVAEDNVAHACWSNVAEAVLKQCCRRRCWSGVAKNTPPKKLVHLWQVSVHQPFFFICLFFTPIFLLRCSRWRRACLVPRRLLHLIKNKEMMTSLPARRHLLHLKEKKAKKWQRAREACRHLLHLKKMQKMPTSWEAPGSLSSPRFFLNYEFTNYIAT